MIPKVIHYIWLGHNPMPKVVKKCLKSWEKFCPDYEIKRWDETNLDLNICKYAKDAYDAKKWAFASDFFRFYILQKEGGIYLDTDVLLLQSLDKFLDNKCFLGIEKSENSIFVNPGLVMGAEKNCKLLDEMVDYYKNDTFSYIQGSGIETVCVKMTKLLEEKYNFKKENKCQQLGDIKIYSAEYFCPIDYAFGKCMYQTKNTVSKHLYSATWQDKKSHFKWLKYFVRKVIGDKNYQKLKEKLRRG